MKHRRIALTGPAGAQAHELDGFRDLLWSPVWASPHSGAGSERVIRTRHWSNPELIGDSLVCPVPLVVRHLNAVPADLLGIADRIAPRDRVELAVEHALRLGHRIGAAAGGTAPGDVMLREVLLQRGQELPTESYAETRALQLLRSLGITPWRQVPILVGNRIRYRADFMMPFVQQLRPDVFRPDLGVLLEVDGRESHEGLFERDHERDATYTGLGFHWLTVTPTQVEHRPDTVRRAIAGAFRKAGWPIGI